MYQGEFTGDLYSFHLSSSFFTTNICLHYTTSILNLLNNFLTSIAIPFRYIFIRSTYLLYILLSNQTTLLISYIIHTTTHKPHTPSRTLHITHFSHPSHPTPLTAYNSLPTPLTRHIPQNRQSLSTQSRITPTAHSLSHHSLSTHSLPTHNPLHIPLRHTLLLPHHSFLHLHLDSDSVHCKESRI